MKVLIINWGSKVKNIIATSLLSAIKRKCPEADIYWSVFLDEDKEVFKYNKHIKKVVNQEEMHNLRGGFYLLINLDPYFDYTEFRYNQFEHKLGCYFDPRANYFHQILKGEEQSESVSLFQIYYILAGMTWKGEGYDLGYFPKTRSKKKRIGLSIANANLRNYIHDNMDIGDMSIWHVPYKKNMFKRMDEINRCKKIVTDDLLTLHLAMSLRKYVYFLKTSELDTKTEFFGNGELYNIPRYAFQ
tara:strand:- start:11617 stop:12348 length:732 start_codon:yes stop_codon:yes gene_type:complete